MLVLVTSLSTSMPLKKFILVININFLSQNLMTFQKISFPLERGLTCGNVICHDFSSNCLLTPLNIHISAKLIRIFMNTYWYNQQGVIKDAPNDKLGTLQVCRCNTAHGKV